MKDYNFTIIPKNENSLKKEENVNFEKKKNIYKISNRKYSNEHS